MYIIVCIAIHTYICIYVCRCVYGVYFIVLLVIDENFKSSGIRSMGATELEHPHKFTSACAITFKIMGSYDTQNCEVCLA